MNANESHVGSLNPARSFGPAVVARQWPHYHWIYWLGPLMGSLLAVAFYRIVKVLEYETAQPDDDATNAAKAEARHLDSRGTATSSGMSPTSPTAPMAMDPLGAPVDPLGALPGDRGAQLSQRANGSNKEPESEKLSELGDHHDRAARQV